MWARAPCSTPLPRRRESANYPFCTIDPNVGVVAVPDHRLDALTEMYHPKKTTPAVVEFVDIAGLVKGASKGQGLGNKFLANIRECDAIVHVVRCFDDENIMHVVADTSTNVPVDPAGDIGVIDIELIMADVEMVERRIDKAQKAAKGDKKYLREVEVFSALKDWLNDATPPAPSTVTRTTPPSSPPPSCSPSSPSSTPPTWMRRGFADCHANAYYRWWRSCRQGGAQVIPVCAKLEAEIAELDAEEKKMFLDDLGVAESGLDRLVKASYTLLGLISYLTSGEDECRAGPSPRVPSAPGRGQDPLRL